MVIKTLKLGGLIFCSIKKMKFIFNINKIIYNSNQSTK